MIVLRSLLFMLVFYMGSLLAVLAALPSAWRGDARVRVYALLWARMHRWCCRHILGIESRVEGRVPHGTGLIAAKHQSMYETIELLLILDEPAIVLKHELAKIPLWGRISTSYGAIPVSREGSASALRAMLRAARTAIASGRPILIFPEGTRVPPGEQPPLRSGFAGLYRQLGLSVFPLAIDSGRLSPRRSILKRPGVVTFRFGEPIPPGLPRGEVETRVHTAINVLDSPA
ncbi:MAG: lysophospholipid acyltransferase family protein [Sphingomonadaceae bacterium]